MPHVAVNVAVAATATVLAGCDAFSPLYDCQQDGQCTPPSGGPGGRCVSGGCAWPDNTCSSGYRFDGSAPPGPAGPRAGQCVGTAAPGSSGFVPVPLAGGRADAASLSLVFGLGATAAYVAGWDGSPLLLRFDTRGAATPLLPPPAPGYVAPRAGAAFPGGLALAQGDRVFLSGDGGATWRTVSLPGARDLCHDGRELLALAQVGVFIINPGGADPDLSLPAATQGVAFFSLAPGLTSPGSAMLLARSDANHGLVYRRDPATGTWALLHEEPSPLTAGWLGPGTWLAAGDGVLLHDGQPASPPPSPPAFLCGAGADDLWALAPGTPALLRRRGDTWSLAGADPLATAYTGLWAGPSPDAAQSAALWALSTYAADRTDRSRLWRLP